MTVNAETLAAVAGVSPKRVYSGTPLTELKPADFRGMIVSTSSPGEYGDRTFVVMDDEAPRAHFYRPGGEMGKSTAVFRVDLRLHPHLSLAEVAGLLEDLKKVFIAYQTAWKKEKNG